MMRKGCLRPGYAVSTWTQTTLRLALGDFPDTDRRRCGDQAVRPFALLAAGVCRRTPATRRIADDPDILAPNLLSRGQLFDDPTTPWPYLITTRMLGSSLGKDGALHRREVYLKRRYLEAGLSGPADETIQQEVQPSESESASRESLVRLLESRKDMPPEYAEITPFHSRFVLRELKRQNRLEQAMKSPIGWLLTWYLGKTDKPVQFEMPTVVGNGTCGGPHVLYYVGGGGSTGVEVVEIPPKTQDCP